MRERAVRTRREPGGGKRRAQAYLPNRLLYPSGQETRPFRFTGRQTFLLERTSLHFSPRGEAKCVRGPSGRGASRLARAGVTAIFASLTPRITKHGMYGSLAVRHFFWSEPGPLPWFSRITRHETRITAFFRVLRPSGGERCRLAPLTWFSRHETRITAFFESRVTAFTVHRRSDISSGATDLHFGPSARGAGCPLGRREFRGFHESRNTRHESRLFMLFPWFLWCPLVLKPFSLVFSAPAC